MSKLRRSEADRAIVVEWDNWAAGKAEKYGPSVDVCFFYHLEKCKPELLDFAYSGDKLRAVQVALREANRIHAM